MQSEAVRKVQQRYSADIHPLVHEALADQQAEIERLIGVENHWRETANEYMFKASDARTRAEQAEAEVGRLNAKCAEWFETYEAKEQQWDDEVQEASRLRTQLAAMQAAMVEAVAISDRVQGYQNARDVIRDLFAPFIPQAD